MGITVPLLDDYASQLLDLSNDIISSDILPYERYGFHLGAMVDAFCHKQIDHLNSICILVKAEQYNDAQIICRSSIESLYLYCGRPMGQKISQENYAQSNGLHTKELKDTAK